MSTTTEDTTTERVLCPMDATWFDPRLGYDGRPLVRSARRVYCRAACQQAASVQRERERRESLAARALGVRLEELEDAGQLVLDGLPSRSTSRGRGMGTRRGLGVAPGQPRR